MTLELGFNLSWCVVEVSAANVLQHSLQTNSRLAEREVHVSVRQLNFLEIVPIVYLFHL